MILRNIAVVFIASVFLVSITACDESDNHNRAESVDEDRAESLCPLAYKPIAWSSDILYLIYDPCPGICTMEIRPRMIANFEPSGGSMRLRIRGCDNYSCDNTAAPELDITTAELFLCDRHPDQEQNTEDVVLRSKDNQTVLHGFWGQPPWSFVVTAASPKPLTFRAAQDPLE